MTLKCASKLFMEANYLLILMFAVNSLVDVISSIDNTVRLSFTMTLNKQQQFKHIQ